VLHNACLARLRLALVFFFPVNNYSYSAEYCSELFGIRPNTEKPILSTALLLTPRKPGHGSLPAFVAHSNDRPIAYIACNQRVDNLVHSGSHISMLCWVGLLKVWHQTRHHHRRHLFKHLQAPQTSVPRDLTALSSQAISLHLNGVEISCIPRQCIYYKDEQQHTDYKVWEDKKN